MGASAIVALILKAVPWQSIFAIAIKFIFMIFDKNEKYQKAKKLMLQFIDEVDRQAPVKVRQQYKRDIEALRAELRAEAIKNKSNEDEAKNYKKAYKDIEEELVRIKSKEQ